MQALAMPASRYIFGTLPWYSVTMVSAIVVAILLALREEKRRGLPKDTVIDLALWLIPCGIVGARLYYVAFTWDLFRSRPLAILEIWKGGLAIYGALIAGVLRPLCSPGGASCAFSRWWTWLSPAWPWPSALAVGGITSIWKPMACPSPTRLAVFPRGCVDTGKRSARVAHGHLLL